MGIKRNGILEYGLFNSQYSASSRGGFTLTPNIFLNTDLSSTYTSSAGLGTGIYANNWGGYNGGISNPETNYHACINNTKFGYNVYEFNESNGVHNWKGMSQNITDRVTGTGNHMFSVDLYQNMSGAKLFGGFYYKKEGASSNSFASGQFTITTDKIPVNKWGRVSIIAPFNNDVAEGASIYFYIYGYGFSSSATLYMKRMKLEDNTVPTPWCSNSADTNYMQVDNEYYSSAFIANDFIEI